MAVDKSGNRVRQMFGEIAPRYDLLNHLLSMNIDRYWRWRTVALTAPQTDGPILDVCTGTGDLAIAYAKKSTGPIVAADFCPEMLSLGRNKRDKMGITERIAFIEADAQQLPFEADRFDLVTVAFGLRNVSDTERGLEEMVRVCRPGGCVAVLEFSMPGWGPLRSIYSWYFRAVLPRIGQWLARNKQDAYGYLPASVSEFPSGQVLADKMVACGLEDVVFYPFTLGIATLYFGSKAKGQDEDSSYVSHSLAKAV